MSRGSSWNSGRLITTVTNISEQPHRTEILLVCCVGCKRRSIRRVQVWWVSLEKPPTLSLQTSQEKQQSLKLLHSWLPHWKDFKPPTISPAKIHLLLTLTGLYPKSHKYVQPVSSVSNDLLFTQPNYQKTTEKICLFLQEKKGTKVATLCKAILVLTTQKYYKVFID